MSVSGKIPHVFSGEDDQAVVLSLPLAFLRLIASGVYTYEIDWRGEDWESDSPTSEQLAIIEGALTAVTVAADGVSLEGGGMNSIEDSEFVLVDITQTTNIIATIDHSDLPEDAAGCKAIYCRVNYYVGSGSAIFNSVDGDSASVRARQVRQNATTAQTDFMVFPINSGQITFRVNGSFSTDRHLDVLLVGWW